MSFSSLAADQPNSNVVSTVHSPYRGAPGIPAAPPRDGQRPLSSTLQRTVQPRPQLCHGHAQVTACGPIITYGTIRSPRKWDHSYVWWDRSNCVDYDITTAGTYSRAHSGGARSQKVSEQLTVNANNTRNVQHLIHPVHRYSLKNVYINATRPKPQPEWGLLLSSKLNWLTRNVQILKRLWTILSCQTLKKMGKLICFNFEKIFFVCFFFPDEGIVKLKQLVGWI